ncbi:hypothetical protein AB0H88_35290 [Nonomuraea sp. NPDC050680]|uniref:hypothetical protein n=1 Tax=Nonomuraea sp. NPDC050680 TaxID=3154630 RepID=UPI0033C6E9EA
MFGTAARQLGYAWSMLAGRRFRVKDVTALVEDLRATLSRSIAQILIERAATMTGAAFVHVGLVDPRATLDRLAVPLHVPGKRPQMTHLNTTASYLAALVQEAERGGWDAKDFGVEEQRGQYGPRLATKMDRGLRGPFQEDLNGAQDGEVVHHEVPNP